MSSPPLPAQPLPVLNGIPDNLLVQLTGFHPDGSPSWALPGNGDFIGYLPAAVQKMLPHHFIGPQLELVARPGDKPRPLVNHIVDPEGLDKALGTLERLLATVPAACFNHPAAVRDSARERVAAKLADIPGVRMPRTVRVRLDEPAELAAVAAANGIAFPLIVRVAGVHGGTTTVLIEDEDGVRAGLRRIPWGGRELFVTQFVDYRDDDGLFRKSRLVFIGDQIVLRHRIVADTWHVHRSARKPESLAEETAALADFPRLLPSLRPTLDAVADAMDLDLFGMDCSLRPDGSVLVFEANNAMNFMTNRGPTPNIWEAPVQRIHDALVALLADPSRWRHPGARAT